MKFLIQCWGDETQQMRLMSYSSYLLSISGPLVICMLANLRNVVPMARVSCFAWTTALHPRYIVKRLQYLKPASGTIWKPFLAICLIWPLFNSLYRVCIYIFVAEKKTITFYKIVLCTDGIAAIHWGCFCYLVSLLRLSIRTQLYLDVIFLRKNLGKLDICRSRLIASLDEYGSLCKLCGIWMILTVLMNSVGLVTHTGWNYLLYSGKISMNTTTFHVNLMIWSELLMFFALPLIAVGGLDLRQICKDVLTQIYAVRVICKNIFFEER